MELDNKEKTNEIQNNIVLDNINDLSNFFEIFSTKSKLQILSALDRQELCVIELAKVIGKTKSAVSHQLRSLKEQNLVKSRKQGKEVFYSLKDDHIGRILEIAVEHIMEAEL